MIVVSNVNPRVDGVIISRDWFSHIQFPRRPIISHSFHHLAAIRVCVKGGLGISHLSGILGDNFFANAITDGDGSNQPFKFKILVTWVHSGDLTYECIEFLMHFN